MPPIVKFLRTLVFLPVKKAEEQERMAQHVELGVKRARDDAHHKLHMIDHHASQLRETFDKLLERT